MSLPALGTFGGAVIAGAHNHDPVALVSREPRLGLVRESTYFYAYLRDDHARLTSALRRVSEPVGWPSRLLTRTVQPDGLMDRHELPVRTAHTAAITTALHDGAAVFTADATEADEPFSATIDRSSLRWDEGRALHLAGDDISQGLQWFLPDAAGSELYVSRLFEVRGDLHGAPVHGIVGVDQVFLDPGRQNYVDDPITAGHLSLAWCTWANRYDDGSSESGHFAFGPGRFGFAISSDCEGRVRVGAKVAGALELDGGSPDRARFEIDGESWEYAVDPGGRCRPLGGPVLQSEGCLRRVGDTRTPVVWTASLEVPA